MHISLNYNVYNRGLNTGHQRCKVVKIDGLNDKELKMLSTSWSQVLVEILKKTFI